MNNLGVVRGELITSKTVEDSSFRFHNVDLHLHVEMKHLAAFTVLIQRKRSH